MRDGWYFVHQSLDGRNNGTWSPFCDLLKNLQTLLHGIVTVNICGIKESVLRWIIKGLAAVKPIVLDDLPRASLLIGHDQTKPFRV